MTAVRRPDGGGVPVTPPDKPQRQEGDGPHYTPWIFFDHDDPSAPTGVFYLSPDLWVESSLGHNLPKEGEPNRVFARVHNRGLMDATNVNVRFYWADPSAAITEASAHPIGGSGAAATRTGVFIPAAASPGADSSVVVACPSPWYPVHLGHECLLAKAWCPGLDPAGGAEPALDPVSDRHAAQHNVNVQLLPPGGNFAISVVVANIGRFEQRARIEVHALPFEQVARSLAGLRVALRGKPARPERGLPVKVALDEERSFLVQHDAALARLLLAADGAAGEGRRGASAGVLVAGFDAVLAPWEQRSLRLQGRVPDGARPGEVFGFEVTQRLGGLLTGGYQCLVAVGHPRRQDG